MWTILLPLAFAGDYSYRQALPGYHYSFPRDHFEHLDFRTEWWYYSGNVRDAEGRRYGFELVFFRQAQRRGRSDNRSAWRIDDLYMAHLALTDIDGRRFRYYKRLNRAGPGIAGASFAQRRIWNGNWSARWESNRQILEAVAEDCRFSLALNPLKPPVIHGEHGVSQKAAGAGNASYYVSFSRMSVEGTLDHHAVRGLAWMDHEWFTHLLAEEQVGWDWFSIQLDNGAELMLFELRRKDGSIDPHSSGTYVDRQGRGRHLTAAEFSLQPLNYWSSPHTKARYSVRWRIQAPSLAISLEGAAALPDQELVAEGAADPSYWEGAVSYAGSAQGVGYLEMTGYDKPLRLE